MIQKRKLRPVDEILREENELAGDVFNFLVKYDSKEITVDFSKTLDGLVLANNRVFISERWLA